MSFVWLTSFGVIGVDEAGACAGDDLDVGGVPRVHNLRFPYQGRPAGVGGDGLSGVRPDRQSATGPRGHQAEPVLHPADPGADHARGGVSEPDVSFPGQGERRRGTPAARRWRRLGVLIAPGLLTALISGIRMAQTYPVR